MFVRSYWIATQSALSAHLLRQVLYELETSGPMVTALSKAWLQDSSNVAGLSTPSIVGEAREAHASRSGVGVGVAAEVVLDEVVVDEEVVDDVVLEDVVGTERVLDLLVVVDEDVVDVVDCTVTSLTTAYPGPGAATGSPLIELISTQLYSVRALKFLSELGPGLRATAVQPAVVVQISIQVLGRIW